MFGLGAYKEYRLEKQKPIYDRIKIIMDSLYKFIPKRDDYYKSKDGDVPKQRRLRQIEKGMINLTA